MMLLPLVQSCLFSKSLSEKWEEEFFALLSQSPQAIQEDGSSTCHCCQDCSQDLPLASSVLHCFPKVLHQLLNVFLNLSSATKNKYHGMKFIKYFLFQSVQCRVHIIYLTSYPQKADHSTLTGIWYLYSWC